ncbi:MAG: hypothetical protein ABSA47_11080 [Verrucomicrobiota bacterium]|jgi:hypothetical protein
MNTETKVKKLVRQIIPKGKAFRISWVPAGFGRYRVLRVITPAWRTLPRFERILKVQNVISDGLAKNERKHILRVSVLTSNEYKRLHPALLTPRPPRRHHLRKPANGGL